MSDINRAIQIERSQRQLESLAGDGFTVRFEGGTFYVESTIGERTYWIPENINGFPIVVSTSIANH